MEFLGLQYFCTIVQEGSISKAAERLYITQQSLSGYISRLEQRYGCTFFERRPKLKLTNAGELFYAFAERVTAENNLIIEKLAEGTSQMKRFPIGISHNYEKYLLPIILPSYREVCPHILPSIHIVDRGGEESSLQNMSVYCNISVTNQKYPGIQSETLMPSTFYAIIPEGLLSEDFILSAGNSIPLHQLLQLPTILPPPYSRLRKAINRYCEKKQITPKIYIESTLPEASLEYTKIGFGCCMLPKLTLYYLMQSHQLPPGIRIMELDLDGSSITADTVNIVYRKDILLPEYVTQFIQCAKQACINYDMSSAAAIRSFLPVPFPENRKHDASLY